MAAAGERGEPAGSPAMLLTGCGLDIFERMDECSRLRRSKIDTLNEYETSLKCLFLAVRMLGEKEPHLTIDEKCQKQCNTEEFVQFWFPETKVPGPRTS